MSTKIYTSRQSGGQNPARERIIDDIVRTYKTASFKDKQKIFVIVPKQESFQIERELIEKVGEGGLLGVQILDFDRFFYFLLEQLGQGLKIVDAHGKIMLVEKALSENKEDLQIYSNLRNVSLSGQLIGQISEFKEVALTPEQLEEKKEAFKDSLLDEKLTDLSKIYKTFEEILGTDRFDENDLYHYIYERLEEISLLKEAKLFFVDPTIIENRLIEFLVRYSGMGEVKLNLINDADPTCRDMSAFFASNRSLERINMAMTEFGQNVEVQNLPLSEDRSELNYLSRELFSFLPSVYPGVNDQVKVFQENDPWDEVNRAAQVILQKRAKGHKYQDMAIIATDRKYEEIIRRVFPQYQIPIFIDNTIKVIDNQFIQFILSFLETVASDLKRSSLLEFLKSSFYHIDSSKIELFENYLIEAGIRPWELNKDFTRFPKHWPEERQEENLEILNEIRKEILADLEAVNLEKKGSFDYFIKKIKSFIKRHKCEEKLIELEEAFSATKEVDLASSFRQIWNILIEVLDQMSFVLGKDQTDLDEFLSVLKAGLSSYEIGILPESTDAVIVSSISRAELPETSYCLFLGLNEELFPKQIEETSLLSEEEKKKLYEIMEVPAYFINDHSFYHQLEELRFYELATKARDGVYFFYSLFDQQGSPLLPSRYIGTLKEIYGESIYPVYPKLFPFLTKKRAPIILETMDAYDSQTVQIREIIKQWNKDNKELSAYWDELLLSDDELSEDLASNLYTDSEKKVRVSSSRLEEFARCPYRHFLRYGLSPVAREEYSVSNLDTGNLTHQVFERFIRDLKSEAYENNQELSETIESYVKDPGKLEKTCEDLFKVMYEDSLEVKRYQYNATNRFFIRKIFRMIKNAIYIILLQFENSQYLPYLTEMPFNYPLNSDLELTGIIDRIDVKDEGDDLKVRVVDYKTGSPKIDYSKLFYGYSLQLALYLSQAIEIVRQREEKQTEPKGSFYFYADKSESSNPNNEDLLSEVFNNFKLIGIYEKEDTKEKLIDIKDGPSKMAPQRLTKEELNKLLDHTKGLVEELGERIKNGELKIEPLVQNLDTVGCDFCSYGDICRFDPNLARDKCKNIKTLDKETFFEVIENGD